MRHLTNLHTVEKDIRERISLGLDRAGIFHRIFCRIKSPHSLEKKIHSKNYSQDGKKLQDLLGVRVVTYFQEDIPILTDFLKSEFRFRDDMIDNPSDFEFKPRRTNLIFEIPEEHKEQFKVNIGDSPIDITFEIQLRTVFSEGWHEVEHDLKYKQPDDWELNKHLIRPLNGILATLENCDWILSGIFDQMAYNSYKAKQWEAMIRHKLRIRTLPTSLNIELRNLLTNSPTLSKEIFRTNRDEIITMILESRISIPLTIENLILLINFVYINDPEINRITPEQLSNQFPKEVRFQGNPALP